MLMISCLICYVALPISNTHSKSMGVVTWKNYNRHTESTSKLRYIIYLTHSERFISFETF